MFYLLEKKANISSFQAIKEFAKNNNIKKIGHTGTLDPLATGLLLVATNADTKLIEYVDKGFKRYATEIQLGKVSNTYDIDGEIQDVCNKIPTHEEIKKAIMKFMGKSQQIPPAFSAKKINGQRAYHLARNQKTVKLKAIDIEAKNIKITSIIKDKVTFELTVSRGTYIRSIIHDIGNDLGCGAIMTQLRRTAIGNLTEKDLNQKIPIEKIFIHEIINISDIEDLKNGKAIKFIYKNGTYGLKYKQDLIGVGIIQDNLLKTIKLLGQKL